MTKFKSINSFPMIVMPLVLLAELGFEWTTYREVREHSKVKLKWPTSYQAFKHMHIKARTTTQQSEDTLECSMHINPRAK